MDAPTGFVNGNEATEPAPAPVAQATAVCCQCEATFSYVVKFRGRQKTPAPRSMCDACRQRNNKQAQARTLERVRRKEGEPTAWSAQGLNALALRTEREAGAILGLRQQQIQVTTRKALFRLRRLLLEPVRIYREPEPSLTFSYREIEVDLRSWKAALVVMRLELSEQTAEGSEDGLDILVLEMEREIGDFEDALRRAVDGQKQGAKATS